VKILFSGKYFDRMMSCVAVLRATRPPTQQPNRKQSDNSKLSNEQAVAAVNQSPTITTTTKETQKERQFFPPFINI